jgi:hypothetical protein
MQWQQMIKIIIPFWTVEITINRFKLLFWLFLAVKIPCGIIFSCLAKSKNELVTESDYFMERKQLGHSGMACPGGTKTFFMKK